VRRYSHAEDREIVGLLAAAVAFGRVTHILQSLENLLERMGPRPAVWLRERRVKGMVSDLEGWRHRWATGTEAANLLLAVRGVLREWGTLGRAWCALRQPSDRDAHDTLIHWVACLERCGLAADNSLVPRPNRPSAAKRLHLYLRWMVRKDAIDPGGWGELPARLLVPLDVHMHRMARLLGATNRSVADLRAAREVTEWFRQVDPQDPVRFDFALTRLPIHDGLKVSEVRGALLGEQRFPLPGASNKNDTEMRDVGFG